MEGMEEPFHTSSVVDEEERERHLMRLQIEAAENEGMVCSVVSRISQEEES